MTSIPANQTFGDKIADIKERCSLQRVKSCLKPTKVPLSIFIIS